MSTATATPIKIQAREIVRYANRHGLTLARYACGSDNQRQCARGIIRHAVNKKTSMYKEEINEAVSLTSADMDSLESGFDYGRYQRDENCAPSLKYFKIGQNVARLAGLT
jgi:tRNA(Ile)-lysidine synthase TilS/MesJ